MAGEELWTLMQPPYLPASHTEKLEGGLSSHLWALSHTSSAQTPLSEVEVAAAMTLALRLLLYWKV